MNLCTRQALQILQERHAVFLIAAASRRRVSDIHALSVAGEHLQFSGDTVRLLPRSGYLAKNQTMDFTPQLIVLPYIRRALQSPDDGPWCLVRAPGGYSDLGWVRMCGPEFQLLPYSKTWPLANSQPISKPHFSTGTHVKTNQCHLPPYKKTFV